MVLWSRGRDRIEMMVLCVLATRPLPTV
jgi:hypothetical protein